MSALAANLEGQSLGGRAQKIVTDGHALTGELEALRIDALGSAEVKRGLLLIHDRAQIQRDRAQKQRNSNSLSGTDIAIAAKCVHAAATVNLCADMIDQLERTGELDDEDRALCASLLRDIAAVDE